MSNDTFEIVGKVEDSTGFMSCALNALWLAQMDLEHNLMIRNASTGGMGYYLQVCSAMVPAIRELDRIREELDAIIEAAYKQKRRTQNDN